MAVGVESPWKNLAIKAVGQEGLFPVQTLCEIADIARSSYYKWLKHTASTREMENRQLAQDMLALHEEVHGIYGYRRLTLNLSRRAKKQINHKRIQRLMKIEGIQSVIRRKKKKYLYASPEQVAENLLNREFNAEGRNEKWLTDVTEFKYGNGQKAYLSAILDLHDNVIVANTQPLKHFKRTSMRTFIFTITNDYRKN
ncbi:IS3 family transposase [Paenibacillus lycopersici]|uniref:IS3 family transposase n=1 Tax=Paenibacillus lycopersici TaxID=2704462 RepID=A0A6C0G5E0_9BACL|nr:IS3 family transposase [Paenibacillus lycopersici]QHT63301.1 IS3 family transposase [Paenibacillus lycopersici]